MALTAVLTGTYRNPELRFKFGWGATLPSGKSAQDWMKKLPGRRWDNSEKTWYITGTGINPDKFFAAAKIDVDFSEATGDLAGLTSLETLWRPIIQRSQRFPHMAFVRPRMAGFERVSMILGPGAVWDKTRQRFEVMLADLVTDDGEPKKGMRLDQDTLDAAVTARQLEAIPANVRAAARELASSTGVEGDFQHELSPRTQELIDIVATHSGYLPTWFGLALYPFQVAGAYAIAGGHRALADAPGLGKCVLPETRVLANGSYAPIEQLWNDAASASRPTPDYDGIGEIIALSPGQMRVQALNDSATVARTVDASHLYRERISAPVKSIRTASGASITATLPHKFLTPSGWTGAIKAGDTIAEPDDDTPLRWTRVISVEYSDYDGWVYDLTVPDGANYIAEDLWCHNTRQALAAAAIARSRRTVIIVPPLVVENWCREAYAALGPGLKRIQPPVDPVVEPAPSKRKSKAKPKAPPKKPDFPAYIVPIRAGKKVPPFPEAGVVVVADSLLGSRPELLDDLVAWAPQAALFDEVHRSRTWAGKRATANRNLACSVDALRLPMTGTPFLQNPAEGTNMLAIAGLLDPVFGGASKFMETYTTQNHFGAFLPNRKMLPQLEQMLSHSCWVRRNKSAVLKQLPPKLRTTRYVEIDPKGFKAAHDTLYEKVTEWIDEQRAAGEIISKESIKDFARSRVDLITPLRAAAGIAKIPAAIEIISEWMEATTEVRNGKRVYTRPLIVWVHHQPVMQALIEAVEKAGIADAGFIDGGVAQHKRQLVADRMQNGEIGVIFCSIGAAGFGITLTASSDTIFIETDWTPANISQAEDRAHRIGQQNTCMVTTLLATNTLDAHMRAILRNKAKDLDVLMPGADNNVTRMTSVLNEQTNAYEVLTEEDKELEKSFKSLGDIVENIVQDILLIRGYELAA
ncbi:ATP-dependent helicase [Paeniglutamicibacter antarcticus]|uniref:ATP-dependent helicase n=1 Tax=Arthrobacter terrae TaxID=2935737 RepID=A0A931CPM1_9MICC|nr:SNF2-related protein [Arthrobacter terrae]MBG0738684.1 ATP-dependent helicase [Arthrobacter terrae]